MRANHVLETSTQTTGPDAPASAPVGARVLQRRRRPAGYRARLAASQEDVRSAQFLRFAVFNLELNEGLEQSYATCLDVDPFDVLCDHLLVEDVGSGHVIGTYRLQTGLTAAGGLGYYSAQEFDLAPFESVRAQVVELGRACVDRGHRNLTVLGLLWRGIAEYAAQKGGRYLLGCSSLSTTDPVQAASAYQSLQPFLAPGPWRTNPLPALACPMDRLPDVPTPLPKLLRAYLSLGAKICGPPALDREFGTVDFLTLMDLQALPAAVLERLAG